MSVFELISSKKSFASKWIGHTKLNEYGLHKARVHLADACLAARRMQGFGAPANFSTFQRDGITVMPNYLPSDGFASIKMEALRIFADAADNNPIAGNAARKGFGEKQPFAGGFDRYDGGTLNRFLDITEEGTPECYKFASSLAISQLYCQAAGTIKRPAKFQLYQTIHGDDSTNPDNQKLLHRDTFHSAIKLWYFFKDVELEQGPLEYVVGSHRMGEKRLKWEHQKSVRASSGKRGATQGGAFRASAADLRYMDLPQPTSFPVKANTLILADIRGFHRRGHAETHSERLGIYANFRPFPFSPFRC